MKYELHIPTEQYGFIAVEAEGSADHAAALYKEVAAAFAPQPLNILPEKEFNQFLDRMLLGESNHLEEYNKMSPNQQLIVQAVKRALKRLKANENQNEN